MFCVCIFVPNSDHSSHSLGIGKTLSWGPLTVGTKLESLQPIFSLSTFKLQVKLSLMRCCTNKSCCSFMHTSLQVPWLKTCKWLVQDPSFPEHYINLNKPSQVAFFFYSRRLKDPPTTRLCCTLHLQKHLHLISAYVSRSWTTHTFRQTAVHSSHTPSHVDSHQAELAHNEFEELHTYSKVIYFISPIKGSDKIVAQHCKSISLSPLFISPRSTNSKAHPSRQPH